MVVRTGQAIYSLLVSGDRPSLLHSLANGGTSEGNVGEYWYYHHWISIIDAGIYCILQSTRLIHGDRYYGTCKGRVKL